MDEKELLVIVEKSRKIKSSSWETLFNEKYNSWDCNSRKALIDRYCNKIQMKAFTLIEMLKDGDFKQTVLDFTIQTINESNTLIEMLKDGDINEYNLKISELMT